ncbi:rhomboid-like protein [Streptomyces sp. NPDC001606]
MERTATGPVAPALPADSPLPGGVVVADLLDGMPAPRGALAGAADVREAVETTETAQPAAAAPVVRRPPSVLPARLGRLVPTPAGTPFTFGYATLLAVTSVIAMVADPALVHALYRDSSTDVFHLACSPVTVLVASALWIAGGMVSPYAFAFVLVLTALERRIGGARAAAVFLSGHILATLATEVPVGLAVALGHLPLTSLHRLDYGISFGVAASTGALAGLLTPWLRWPLLVSVAGLLLDDLAAFTDPMTDWGHLIALTIGVLAWPLVRRWQHRA